MTNYVLGFIFSSDLGGVYLIRKAHPEWQKGRWNGIGGKIELEETSLNAMIRECREECGVYTLDSFWKYIGYMKGSDFSCDIYYSILLPEMSEPRTCEAEVVAWHPLDIIQSANSQFIEHVPALIGMCREHLSRPNLKIIMNYA